MKRIMTALTALTVLAACGGGSTSNPPPVEKRPTTSTEFRALQSDVNSASFDSGVFDATPFSDLPTSGSATYDGVAVFREQGSTAPSVVWDGDDPDLLARMNMTANFGTETVRGGIDRFHDADTGERVQGELFLTGGLFNDAGGVIRSSIAGDMPTRNGPDNAGGTLVGNFTDNIGGVSGGMAIQTPSGNWEGLFEAGRD